MIRDNYLNIVSGLEVKENLLVIKDSLKDRNKGGREKEALIFAINGDISKFVELLNNSDPKIRKNAAIVLGILGIQEAAEPLFKAYSEDDIKYNKAAYVEALRALDYSEYQDALKKRYDELRSNPISEDDKKHVLDEMKQLKAIFGTGKIEFTGYELLNECVLTTNRNHKNLTAEAVGRLPHKEFTAGVMVKTKNLKQLRVIRTYDEMLFIPDSVKTVSFSAKEAAKELIDGGIIKYITERLGYAGEKAENREISTVKFRIDLRADKETKDSDFSKKLAGELEILSNWKLTNSTSDYDVEIRLVKNSSGNLNVLVNFALLKDGRFTYRKESIAATVKPYLAATLVELAHPYFRKNAAVLDPFCGVGTLIAEREIAGNARIYYGIDIFGEAIEKAKTNLKLAGVLRKTELINKDFFAFSHDYKFNEVITEMPFETASKSSKDIESIYSSFFAKIRSLLEKDAVLIIYTRNPEYVKSYGELNDFKIRENFEISKFENSYLMILE
ncbi:MAG: HEAT repeat domain-containing protein [Lachnospiraceae bacterium]|nr:HEAT repeat domain-containing protein [Lachnospiraceae bacterium]